jgi:hypothetical protein
MSSCTRAGSIPREAAMPATIWDESESSSHVIISRSAEV